MNKRHVSCNAQNFVLCRLGQGLYGERVGALTVVTRDAAITKRVESQLKLVWLRLLRVNARVLNFAVSSGIDLVYCVAERSIMVSVYVRLCCAH